MKAMVLPSGEMAAFADEPFAQPPDRDRETIRDVPVESSVKTTSVRDQSGSGASFAALRNSQTSASRLPSADIDMVRTCVHVTPGAAGRGTGRSPGTASCQIRAVEAQS